jgi:hypothetical protein
MSNSIVWLIFLLVIPYAAAVLFSKLLYRNRNRMGTFLRPTRGHLVATVSLALFMPLGLYKGIPLTALFMLLSRDPDFSVAMEIFWLILFCALCYVPASLAVSGISNKILRVLALFLFWAGYYVLSLLVSLLGSGGAKNLEGYLLPGLLR